MSKSREFTHAWQALFLIKWQGAVSDTRQNSPFYRKLKAFNSQSIRYIPTYQTDGQKFIADLVFNTDKVKYFGHFQLSFWYKLKIFPNLKDSTNSTAKKRTITTKVCKVLKEKELWKLIKCLI